MNENASNVALLTQVILEIFRVNGRLITAGDELVRPIGLTSARWQVLGAIALSSQPLTVAELARSMGLARQSVQRLINELADEQCVRLIENPHHRRAKLVAFTPRGQALCAAAVERQGPWAHALGDGLDPALIKQTLDLLRVLRQRLEASQPAAPI